MPAFKERPGKELIIDRMPHEGNTENEGQVQWNTFPPE